MGQLRLPERACCLEASLLACGDLADKVLTSLDTAFAEAVTYPQHEAREQIRIALSRLFTESGVAVEKEG